MTHIEIIGVPQLSYRAPQDLPTRGRPRKGLTLPALPAEMVYGMSELEREWFTFFLKAVRSEYPDLTPLEESLLPLAAADYVNTLRIQALQLSTKELLSNARSHPGTHLREWLSIFSSRKLQNKQPVVDSDNDWFVQQMAEED